MIIRDVKTNYELLMEMWFKTPAVVKVYPENFVPLNTNMVASDCRCNEMRTSCVGQSDRADKRRVSSNKERIPTSQDGSLYI